MPNTVTTHHDPDLRPHQAAVDVAVHLHHGWNVDRWTDKREPGHGAARLVIGHHLDVTVYGSADELERVADQIRQAADQIRAAQR